MAAASAYDLVVIGGGPGGYTAAVRAAQLGLKTACVEKWPRLAACASTWAASRAGPCWTQAKISPGADPVRRARHHHRRGRHRHRQMMSRKEQVVKDLTDNVRKLLEAHKVEIIHGSAALAGKNRVEVSGENPLTLDAKNIILATGSEPASLPGIAFDGKLIVSSTEALQFDGVPQNLGIIGGGYIASSWLGVAAAGRPGHRDRMLPDIVAAMTAR